ncbi:hypothetical protein AWW68_16110 [Roseivirga spongicola]|uniref:Acetyltransferase n=1 Tax=Roseivirga spongicola TaxID=333140 RepID=A0A150X6B2_9BACT|nr:MULTISPECIES: acyltransferase [Roseivirga]KYG74172.1 hypothetical protein AWW68_16110 [Roseivirga spongicola]
MKTRVARLITRFWIRFDHYIKSNTISDEYNYFYRKRLNALGKGVKFYGFIDIINPNKVSIGDNCTLNQGVLIAARESVIIGNNVRISPYTIILTHGLNLLQYPRTHYEKAVKIEDDVWIASQCTILAGVTIGKGSVVAAGAVVNSDVEPYTLVAGVPAKRIKRLDLPIIQ